MTRELLRKWLRAAFPVQPLPPEFRALAKRCGEAADAEL